MREYAAELVRLAPDVILSQGTPNVAALKQATTSIPIVFAVVNDPVAQGFIASMAHPGGNITGFSFLEYSMVGKSLEMLKQVVLRVTRVAVMFNPETYPYYDIHLRSFETFARPLSLELTGASIRNPAEIEQAIAKLGRQPSSALLVTPDPFTVVHRGAIIRAAEQHRVPATYSFRQHVQEGALMSYGADTNDIFRRSASYIDRILKGAKPADLPAQAPVKFELAINLKTAKDARPRSAADTARACRRGDRVMRRREFITLLGGAAAWPLAARAQQTERLRRIGVLTAMSETDPTLPPRMAAFQKGLQAFGWAEGRNVSIVYRHATSDLDRLKSAALELVAAAPELIVVWSNPAVMAMRAVDRSIPVVFVSVGDPVGSGFVESLGRPGGNLTGFTAFEPEMGGKWLEHLKEVAPALTRAMVLLHPDIAANFEFYRAAQAAGTALRINVDAVHVRGAADIQRAVSALAGEPHAGVLVLPNPASASHRELIASLSAAHPRTIDRRLSLLRRERGAHRLWPRDESTCGGAPRPTLIVSYAATRPRACPCRRQ